MSGSSEFPDTGPSQFLVKMQAVAVRLFRAFPRLRAKAATAGQMADFVTWQERVFGHRLEMYGRRGAVGTGPTTIRPEPTAFRIGVRRRARLRNQLVADPTRA